MTLISVATAGFAESAPPSSTQRSVSAELQKLNEILFRAEKSKLTFPGRVGLRSLEVAKLRSYDLSFQSFLLLLLPSIASMSSSTNGLKSPRYLTF